MGENTVINDSRSAAFRRHCAPSQSPLERPPYVLRHDLTAARVQLAVETFRRHMTDEGWQIQLGLELAGWEMYGAKMQPPRSNEINVPHILCERQPTSVIVQDKREWDPQMPGCFDKRIAFCGVESLAESRRTFRLAIFRDAHQRWAYQRDFHDSIGAHGWIVLYHPEIICDLAPWIRRDDVVRTYHSVEPADVPPFSPDRPREALVSGASNGTIYPFRDAVIRSRICEHLPHPGYHAAGTCTPTYLRVLSQFKVHMCTTSIFGYALRKIIESVACGCVVITDLPKGDVLPEIDECLVRVAPNIPMPDLRRLIREQCAGYDPERQSHFARVAREYYDWRVLGRKLGRDIERLRYGRELDQIAQVRPSPEIAWREDFGELLNRHGLLGEAVEIGTDRGDFASAILDQWQGRRLHCVDPWDNGTPGWTGRKPDGSLDTGSHGRPWLHSDRRQDLAVAKLRLQSRHNGRFAIHQLTSRRAAATLGGEFDFVYIDGNHIRDYVAEDIALWWPRVRSGGILAGHDWNGPWQGEVRPAVMAHAAQHGLIIYLVSGDRTTGTTSWYLEKP